MARKRKIKTKFKRRLFLLIIVVLIVLFINKKDKNIEDTILDIFNKTYLNEITNETNTDIKKEWQDIIVSYLDLYTDSLVNLKSRDLTKLFSNEKKEESYLAQTTLDLEIYHHSLQLNDMRLKKAYYDIKIKKVKIKDNKIIIDFTEDNYYNYNYLNDITSIMYDVDNEIILNKDNEKYTIDSIRVEKDNYIIFTSLLEDDFTIQDVDLLKEKYKNYIKTESEKNKNLLVEANSQKYIPKKECEHKYDREKAVNYSYKYIQDRNDYYLDYSNLGGNCANYASQSIHEGGIPMDYKGNEQWKYYSDELNENNVKRGRSSSWSSTYYFYYYAKNNTGFGLCSEVDLNLFYAEPGDIIHIGYKDNNIYSHTTLVSRVAKDKNSIIDILVNSNTSNLKDVPVSSFIYHNKRLIKILGYND